jgi:hypothetical protein
MTGDAHRLAGWLTHEWSAGAHIPGSDLAARVHQTCTLLRDLDRTGIPADDPVIALALQTAGEIRLAIWLHDREQVAARHPATSLGIVR